MRDSAAEEPANSLHVFSDDDGCDSVVAYSAEDAWAVWQEQTGEKRDDYPDKRWEQDPDEEPLSILEETDEGEMVRTTRTRAEWCALNGRGFLCSTEW